MIPDPIRGPKDVSDFNISASKGFKNDVKLSWGGHSLNISTGHCNPITVNNFLNAIKLLKDSPNKNVFDKFTHFHESTNKPGFNSEKVEKFMEDVANSILKKPVSDPTKSRYENFNDLSEQRTHETATVYSEPPQARAPADPIREKYLMKIDRAKAQALLENSDKKAILRPSSRDPNILVISKKGNLQNEFIHYDNEFNESAEKFMHRHGVTTETLLVPAKSVPGPMQEYIMEISGHAAMELLQESTLFNAILRQSESDPTTVALTIKNPGSGEMRHVINGKHEPIEKFMKDNYVTKSILLHP